MRKSFRHTVRINRSLDLAAAFGGTSLARRSRATRSRPSPLMVNPSRQRGHNRDTYTGFLKFWELSDTSAL